MTLTPHEERRGTRRVMVAGAAVAIIALLAIMAWPFLPNSGSPQLSPPASQTDMRSSQPEGESTIAKTTSPPPESDARATTQDGDSGKRARDISQSATNRLELTAEQRQAIRTYVAQQGQQRTARPNFTISVGAAVPREVELQDLPGELATALPNYRADQYVLVGDQLVIVEKQSRRIIAIVPAAG